MSSAWEGEWTEIIVWWWKDTEAFLQGSATRCYYVSDNAMVTPLSSAVSKKQYTVYPEIDYVNLKGTL